MTIYRLYAENGNRAGFWIQHRSWENACAQVTSIAGHDMGKLPGAAPAYGGAPVTVSTFDVRSGRKLTSGTVLEHPDDRNYSRIAEPAWFHPPAHFYVKPSVAAHGQRSQLAS